MNCDDAFDALTDPTGADAAELAEHLAKCPRCRELKQVLEPALSLLSGNRPAEPAMAPLRSPDGPVSDAAVPQKAFLSVEAIGVAEAAAARLAALSAPGARSAAQIAPGARSAALSAAGDSRSSVRLPRQRFSRSVLQALVCAAVGGLAVFCVGLWTGKSDGARQPSLAPDAVPAGVCTRDAVPPNATKTPGKNARAVILSCVACHLQDKQPRRERLSTSLFPSPQRVSDTALFVWLQADVVSAQEAIRPPAPGTADRALGSEYA